MVIPQAFCVCSHAKWESRVTPDSILFMACDSAFDAFRQATEHLDDDLLKRASFQGIFFNLIRRGEYQRGSGLNLRVFTIERSEPTSDNESWPRVAFTNGDAGSCGTTFNDATYGHTERSFAPEQFGLKGPVICQDDLIYNWNTEMFLEGYLNALSKRSRRSIENRYLAIYSHFVDKNVTNSSFSKTNGNSGTLPTSGPNLSGLAEASCELQQGDLETVAAELNEEGATDPDDAGWINLGEDGPIYPLYIGQEASQQLLRNNPDLRQDYRWGDATMGDAARLLKRVGATKIIGNYRHVINLFPPRFHWIPTGGGNGNYQRVNTWVMPSKSKGSGAEINPQWRDAPFEAAYVLSPWVFQSNVIRPVNAAAGLRWEPKSYFGEWEFVTGGNRITDAGADCYDPLQKLGRHFAEYKHAPMPLYPKYGRMIIFRRCPASDSSCVTCAS